MRSESLLKAPLVMAVVAAVVLIGGASNAAAADEEPQDGTVIIDGHVFDEDDGLVLTTESFEVPSGGESVGSTYYEAPEGITPRAIWGTSYAYSWEVNDIVYQGAAKAAGNVYQGLRIVQVCFWWTRASVKVSSTYCANATYSGGSWQASPEKTGSATDTLIPDAPVTTFNIQTARIDPQRNY